MIGCEVPVFMCPLCGRECRHGWPEGKDLGGHRVSHCECWPQGYFITLGEEAE